MVPAVFELPSILKFHSTLGSLSTDACDQLSEVVDGLLIGSVQSAENPNVGSSCIYVFLDLGLWRYEEFIGNQ